MDHIKERNEWRIRKYKERQAKAEENKEDFVDVQPVIESTSAFECRELGIRSELAEREALKPEPIDKIRKYYVLWELRNFSLMYNHLAYTIPNSPKILKIAKVLPILL